MTKQIGFISAIRSEAWPDGYPIPNMTVTAVISDPDDYTAISRLMDEGRAVGFSIGGTALARNLTRWETLRYRVGAWFIKLGQRLQP